MFRRYTIQLFNLQLLKIRIIFLIYRVDHKLLSFIFSKILCNIEVQILDLPSDFDILDHLLIFSPLFLNHFRLSMVNQQKHQYFLRFPLHSLKLQAFGKQFFEICSYHLLLLLKFFLYLLVSVR